MPSTNDNNPNGKRPRRMAREPKPQDTGPPQATEVAPEAIAHNDARQSPAAKAPSKTAVILSLLVRPEGATLGQMVEATGWLPHTTRAALSGLKKKGHEVTSTKADGVRTYRVENSSAGA